MEKKAILAHKPKYNTCGTFATHTENYVPINIPTKVHFRMREVKKKLGVTRSMVSLRNEAFDLLFEKYEG